MKILFICKTQLQVVNYLLIFKDFYGQIEEAVFCFTDSKRSGLIQLQHYLPKVSNKIRVIFLNIPSNLRLDAWIKNKNQERNYISCLESVLYTFGLFRKRIENKVFSRCKDILITKKFDRIYLFNYSKLIDWIITNCIKKARDVSIVDEGLGSYLLSSYNVNFLEKVKEILLYDPALVIGKVPEHIKINPLNSKLLLSSEFIDYLKILFPKNNSDERGEETVVWLGQNYGGSGKGVKRKKLLLAHKKIFNKFSEIEKKKKENFSYRPHPARLEVLEEIAKNNLYCKIAGESKIPYEIELILGYKKIPKEIHTINSSGALYLYMLIPDRAMSVRSYFSFKSFFELSGYDLNKEVPGFNLLFEKLQTKYPENIFSETLK